MNAASTTEATEARALDTESTSEIWKQVPDSERFQISSLGNVRDLDDVEEVGGRCEYWVEDGIPFVWVSEREFGFRGPLWKLVLPTWFRGSLMDVEIDYVDSDPLNCAPSNLIVLMDDHKLGHRRPIRTRMVGDIWILDRRMGPRVQIVETGQVFETTKECAEFIGGLPSRIAEVLNGTQKSHKGYTFRRLEG